MNQKQIAILKQNLTIKDGQPVTTSLKVAESFDREHKHILEAIRNLECSPEFHRPNFRQMAHYRANPVTGGQTASPYYEITRDGFFFLAMGFTGHKAALLREGYIRAFDERESELASGMALTKEAVTDVLMAIVAEAARAGRPAEFIPNLIKYRRKGLTHLEIGKLLGAPERTIGGWLKKLTDAGIPLPAQAKHQTTIFFKKLHKDQEKQLALFPVGALR
jgi:Rha family phage regulatory protein